MKALGIQNRCRVFEIPKSVDYIIAPPRMQKYMDISADIYAIYLKYISKEDIHVYSIAEDFIGELTEESYQKTLWTHKPLTDFWRVGAGIARRLEPFGIRTMGDIAAADANLLYQLFGVDAELLIDHAWGREPVTIADIKAYRPHTNCLASGQVLGCDYPFDKGLLIVKEMMDLMCLDLVEKNLVTRIDVTSRLLQIVNTKIRFADILQVGREDK